MKKIGFIGCGNMGGALLRAVLCTIPAEAVLVADADEKKTEVFKEYGVTVSTASAIAEDADYIVLGVTMICNFALEFLYSKFFVFTDAK